MVLGIDAEDIGEGIGSIISGLMAAIPPILREVLPAIIEGLKTSISIVAESVRENAVPITTWVTFLIVVYLAFIGMKYRLISGQRVVSV